MLCDNTIIAIFVALGMPIELYGHYQSFTNIVEIGRRWRLGGDSNNVLIFMIAYKSY